MWSGCPWLFAGEATASPGAWGGMWESTELPDSRQAHTEMGTACRQCQARSVLGHGAGSRAS